MRARARQGKARKEEGERKREGCREREGDLGWGVVCWHEGEMETRQSGDPESQWRGNARLSAHFTTPPNFHQPCALANTSDRHHIWQEYRARRVLWIPSKSGCSSSLILVNNHKTSLFRLRLLTTCMGFRSSDSGCRTNPKLNGHRIVYIAHSIVV